MKMESKQSGRLVWLDLLRILATFGVVWLHVFCKEFPDVASGFDWYVAAVGDGLSRWSVPLFVMISGVLFLDPQREVTYRGLLQKPVPRLLTAYVFWWLFYAALSVAGVLVMGKRLLPGHFMPYFHLWYLPMLMGIYLVCPLLRKVASDERMARAGLIVWAVYLTGYFFHLDRVIHFGVWFGDNVIVGFLGYFLLGRYVASHEVGRKEACWVYVLGAVGAIVGVAGSIAMSLRSGEGDACFMNYRSPHVALMALALFVWVKRNGGRVGERVRSMVEYVRKDLFGIYLVHPLWLLLLSSGPVRNLAPHVLTLPLIVAAVFVCSLYTTKLLRKIPLVRKAVE